MTLLLIKVVFPLNSKPNSLLTSNFLQHRLLFKRKSDPTRPACPSLPTNFNDEWHALLIHHHAYIMHRSYYIYISTTLRHFTLLCAPLLSLCAPLHPFTLLYATLLYFTVFRHIGSIILKYITITLLYSSIKLQLLTLFNVIKLQLTKVIH